MTLNEALLIIIFFTGYFYYIKGRITMKRMVFFIAIFLSVLLVACQNKNQQSGNSMTDTTMNKDTSKISMDLNFLNEAAQGGMFEVQLGMIAEQKAHSKEVKDFGKMMVTDHSNVNDTLRSLAQQYKITLTDTLNKNSQEIIHNMSKLSGRKFDKEYIPLMVKDHTNDIAKFKDEAQAASSPEVREWATKTLPVLQKHLDRIEKIQKAMR